MSQQSNDLVKDRKSYDNALTKPEKRKYTESEALARKKKKRKHVPAENADAQVTQEKEPTPVLKKKKDKKEKKHRRKDEKPLLEEQQLEDDTSLQAEELGDSDIELLDDPNPTDSTTVNNTTSETAVPIPPLNFTTTESTPFHTTQLSLYVPLPAISLSTALPSLISAHLTPLVLTYYAPASGVILAISDETMSSLAAHQPSKPLLLPTSPSPSTPLAQCADDAGVSFVWLTATFLVFRPERGAELEGYINIASEGFIGLVLYNYFQVGIPKARIPNDWRWIAPGGNGAKNKRKKGRKGLLKDVEDDQSSPTVIPDSQATTATTSSAGVEDEDDSTLNAGSWIRADGTPLRENTLLRFRIVDCDVIPAHTRDREKFALHIEGTLLDEVEERKVLEEERVKFELVRNRMQMTPVGHPALMSGGLGVGRSRESSVAASVGGSGRSISGKEKENRSRKGGRQDE